MSKLDLINAGFEVFGAVAQWRNVVKLYQDKKLAGVDWRVTLVFALWGLWNIPFYLGMSAPLSSAAAACLTLANAVWVALAIRYTRQP
jgi:hypothetical protein